MINDCYPISMLLSQATSEIQRFHLLWFLGVCSRRCSNVLEKHCGYLFTCLAFRKEAGEAGELRDVALQNVHRLVADQGKSLKDIYFATH